jgi:hypothetical protein
VKIKSNGSVWLVIISFNESASTPITTSNKPARSILARATAACSELNSSVTSAPSRGQAR